MKALNDCTKEAIGATTVRRATKIMSEAIVAAKNAIDDASGSAAKATVDAVANTTVLEAMESVAQEDTTDAAVSRMAIVAEETAIKFALKTAEVVKLYVSDSESSPICW